MSELRFKLASRGALAAACLVAAGSALYMAGHTAQAATSKTYEVLAIMPFSGAAAISGKAERAGMDAAVKTVNATKIGGKKGILGRRVVVTYKDDTSVGSKGTAVAIEELGKKKYDMVMCGINANTALPCSAAIKQYRIPQLIGTSATDLRKASNYPNVFLTLQPAESSADVVLNQAKKTKKTKLALVFGESAASIELAGILRDRSKRFGVTVTSTTIVPIGTADATPFIQKAMAGGSQAMAIVGFSTLNPVILRARTKLGWNAPAYLDPTASPFNYGSVLTDAERKDVFLSGFGVTTAGSKDNKTREAKLFRKNVAVYDPKPALSLIAHMVAYNAIMLSRAAAVKAKSTDPAKVSKAMGTLKSSKQVPGLVGYKTLFTQRGNHSPQIKASEFSVYKAGSMVDGIQYPAK